MPDAPPETSPVRRPGEPMRLDRRLVQLVGCSRGDAGRYIEGGWVRVDGAVVDEPQHLVTTQAVA